ncbi:M15 family metallopeptidase [Domibacillus sp. A3M-37]|uniref:M15 family metallopeptidase n=1 Tax=Domibacillus TaxID=1433999 RepID=UPI000617B069|nr:MULTISPECIES: M15 family metallopeptidase [Domibacillus]MCP3763112.1 M15 family metallopeptidase [Domibacillus sp. A3M-37]
MKKNVLTLAAVVLLAGCTSAEEETATETEQTAPAEKPAAEKETGPVIDASYFNELKEVDGLQVIQNPENPLVLVNKEFALPSAYTPPDLVRPNVQYSFGDQDIEKSYMRREAAAALETLFKGAKEDGQYLFAVSGYRSYDRQEEILAAGAAASSEEEALKSIAPPGMSEHQSGLAMDISSESNGFELNQSFETTAEGQWLKDHAHEYGFILRYPKGKEDITQYIYEPWHFRYVGGDAAVMIYENDWTLEDYFEQVKPAE